MSAGKEKRSITSASCRIVLLGDLHVYRLWTWPWHLLSKRILGQTSLWLNRRSEFDLDRIPGLVDRVRQLDPTLALQLGDLTTTALVSEFKLAARYLEPLKEGTESFFLVPGNHDRYTFTSKRDRRFEKYFGSHAPGHYPWKRQLSDQLFLVALDPARPRFLDASGKLGPRQLRRLERMLLQLPEAASVILACHYPAGSPPGFVPETRNHRLEDMSALLEVLEASEREILYVHGHVHSPWCWRMEAYPKIVTINAGAPVMRDPLHPFGQGFWQLDASSDGREPWTLRRHIPVGDEKWAERRVKWPTAPGEVSDLS